jgi:hypothetical protein
MEESLIEKQPASRSWLSPPPGGKARLFACSYTWRIPRSREKTKIRNFGREVQGAGNSSASILGVEGWGRYRFRTKTNREKRTCEILHAHVIMYWSDELEQGNGIVRITA